jgi:hypothetical protein
MTSVITRTPFGSRVISMSRTGVAVVAIVDKGGAVVTPLL